MSLFEREVTDDEIMDLLRGKNRGGYIGPKSMVFAEGPDVYSLDLFDRRVVNKLTAFTTGIWALEVFEGVLYAGGEDGCVYNLRTKDKIKQHDSAVYSLCEHDGGLYASLVNGQVVDAFGNTIVRGFDNPIWDMVSHKGDLYAADTKGGFFNVDYEGPMFTREGRINCVFEYKNILLDCGRYDEIRTTIAWGVFAENPNTADHLEYLFEFNDELYVLDEGGDIFYAKSGRKKFALPKGVDCFKVVDREVLADFDSYVDIY